MKVFLYLNYDVETIKDTYGEDGLYTGFSEDRRYNYKFKLSLTHLPYTYNNLSFEDTLEIEDVKAGDFLYLAYALYTDGGTFGCTHGYFHLLGLFKTPEEVKGAIDKAEKNGGDYFPWNSYFASLGSLEFDCLLVYP